MVSLKYLLHGIIKQPCEVGTVLPSVCRDLFSKKVSQRIYFKNKRKEAFIIGQQICKSCTAASLFLFLTSYSLSHTHTHTGRCTKTHTVDTCIFLSAAAWLAGMAYMKCLLNCRFLVGVIIQAYMHGRGGLDFSPESSLPAFLPATSAGYCCELGILMDSPICFQRSFTYLMLKGIFFIQFHCPNPTKPPLFVFSTLPSSLFKVGFFLEKSAVELFQTFLSKSN